MQLKITTSLALCLLLSATAYAGLTTSPDGLPLDSRKNIDSAEENLISQHYLRNSSQLELIDQSLAYLNCKNTLNPTSSFYINISAYLENSTASSTRKGEYVENCGGRTLVSVAHYITPKNSYSCESLLKFNSGMRPSKIINNSITQGADITQRSRITESTPGYDFSILKTGVNKYGQIVKYEGLKICPNDLKDNNSNYMLAQISWNHSQKTVIGETAIPSRTISSRCKILDEINTRSDEYSSNISSYFKHGCDAVPGSSGGPLLNLSDEMVCVAGIQNIGLKEGHSQVRLFNKAVNIRSPLFNKRMNEFLEKSCTNE